MFVAKQFRKKAAESAEALKHTDVPSEIRELQRSERSFSELAQNETWLADNFDKMIRSRDLHAQDETAGKHIDGNAVAEVEEHILRCLGASVIMQWNTIPTKLQRELFDTAGSLGDVLKTSELRGQIARFLHDHKDEEIHRLLIRVQHDGRKTGSCINSKSVNSSSLSRTRSSHWHRVTLKFVISYPLQIEIPATRATASRTPPKNTSGSFPKADLRFRQAFSRDCIGHPKNARPYIKQGYDD
jgi:hypothetical protein